MSALITLTYDDSFTEIAALHGDWPRVQSNDHKENLNGRARWASSYWDAANSLYAVQDVTDHVMFAGPVMQNAGLACELVLKCLLFGGGHSEKDLRKFGHSLLKLYSATEEYLDIYRFLESVRVASLPIELPEEVVERFTQSGRTRDEAEVGWRIFSQHIYILDEIYDRPYRSRYISQGPIVLPEPYILLLGSAILLNAMNERLDLPLTGIAQQQP